MVEGPVTGAGLTIALVCFVVSPDLQRELFSKATIGGLKILIVTTVAMAALRYAWILVAWLCARRRQRE